MKLKIRVDFEAAPAKRRNANLSSYRRQIKAAVTVAMTDAGAKPATDGVGCKLKFYRPLSLTGNRFGDVDNLAKFVLTSMTGVAYVDVSKIMSLNVKKITGKKPRVEIELELPA